MFFNKFGDNKNNRGFTLIELSVSIALLSLFVVIAVAYNKTEDQSIALYREQGRIVNEIYKARAMAISTYGNIDSDNNFSCGYGIYIPPEEDGVGTSTIYLFSDKPDSGNKCAYTDTNPTALNLYDEDEEVESINLDNVSVTANFKSMMFVPPDPQVYADVSDFPLEITIHAPRVASDLRILISSFGQITTTQ